MHSLNYNEDLEAKYRMLKSETRTCFIYGFVLHAACFFLSIVCTQKREKWNIPNGVASYYSVGETEWAQGAGKVVRRVLRSNN